MTISTTTATKPPAEGLFRELLWVHAMIRRDLATVQCLAARVEAGAPAEEVRTTIRGLQTEGPLWKLRVNCLSYCRFVHHHHTLEDTLLFPILRRTEPALGSVVDRLEADHLQIAGYLDAVETAADGLETEDEPVHREQLAATLAGLAEHLLSHLAFEEESIGPILSRWHGPQAE
ncbi:MAG TPA: hemerythrin domain-containing protein [Thermomicrobiales bacterium]|nr:hemerythrin domain-containing protein [Thermomicrobiales bacterium]